MSKDLQKPEQGSEEVDMMLFFRMIGRVFNKIGLFISAVFMKLYHLVLVFLKHLYSRFMWYFGAVILGVALGLFIDLKSEKLYGANLFIETNFKSARQVYENIKQFQELAKIDKDSVELAKRLGIPSTQASKLKGFYIEPDLDENDIAEMYSSFYSRLDSVSRLEINYDRYKNSLTPYNFTIHRIGVASTDKHIYPEIESAFVKQISDNAYLNEILDSGIKIFAKKDNTLITQIEKTDSLASEYLKIRINESKKDRPQSGGNIYMGDAGSSSGNLIMDESQIIRQRISYERERIKLDSIKATKMNIVNVMASFPSSGYDISEWYHKKVYLLPIVLFSMVFVIFVFLGLKDFLEKQDI
ncbi:MAG: hypothetical protein ACON5F_10335 [Jejuia sp.]